MALIVAAGVSLREPVLAQDVTEPSLKAAFLYNFARFTVWPADALPAGSPLVTCVVTDTGIADALERMAKGRPLAGRPVTVVHVAGDPPRNCHLLYASAVLPAARLGALMAASRGAPVLTVVESDGPARVPAITRLYVDNGKLRFDIDHGLAKRGRLQLSSKLLTLARTVHDERNGVAP